MYGVGRPMCSLHVPTLIPGYLQSRVVVWSVVVIVDLRRSPYFQQRTAEKREKCPRRSRKKRETFSPRDYIACLSSIGWLSPLSCHIARLNDK